MPFSKLPVAAALIAMAAFAVPAAAQQMVHHETVTTHTETHPDHADVHHEMHKVCKNIWHNHHRIHRCHTVSWTHHD